MITIHPIPSHMPVHPQSLQVSLRSFDLLNSMIYDLKRSVDLRWLFDPVLHSSLDDLVCICIFQDIISAPPISWMTEDQTCDRPICTDSVRANKAEDLRPEGKCTEMSFLPLSRSILDIEQREIQGWKFETICWFRGPPKAIPPLLNTKCMQGQFKNNKKVGLLFCLPKFERDWKVQ